jgi:hypothetical protein
MKLIGLLSVLALAVVAHSQAIAAVEAPRSPELWRSYTGVSWDTTAAHKIDAASPQAPIAGLHFSRDGKAFVGIALSKNSNTLYWTVTTGDALFAVSTSKLRDRNLSASGLAAAVKTLAHLDFNTDGMMVADDGTVLITDVTHNGITRVNPRTGMTRLIEASDRVFWPDTITAGAESRIYFTSSDTSAHVVQAVARGDERYNIWRFAPPHR